LLKTTKIGQCLQLQLKCGDPYYGSQMKWKFTVGSRGPTTRLLAVDMTFIRVYSTYTVTQNTGC